MKKFVSMLLVLSMVLALCGTAFATAKAGYYVYFKCDTNAYTAAKSSAKTKSVAAKGSYGYCDKICGKYARVIVNASANTKVWFKKCDLNVTDVEAITVVWAKGGKGMSTCRKWTIETNKRLFKGKIKVTGHTNLRKNCGMKFKSQGVVEKCDKLKLTGRYGYDDRGIAWLEVCYKGQKLWISSVYVELAEAQWFELYPEWAYLVFLALL